MLAVSSPSVSFLLRSTQRPGPPPAASGPPQPPRSPPRGPGLGQRDFFFGSLEHPYFGKAGPAQRCRAGARSFHLQLLFTFTTRSVRRRHPRRYHLEWARMSAAHGGSRALLETGIWLQPPRQPPAQARAQDEATNTYEWPGSCGSRQGTSANPQYFSRFYLQTHY